MTDEKMLEELKKGSNTGLQSASLAIVVKEDKTYVKECNPSERLYSISSLADTAAINGDSYQEQAAEPGHEGTNSNSNDHGCFHAIDESEIPNSGPATSKESKVLNSLKTSRTVDAKVCRLPLDSRSLLSKSSSNFSTFSLESLLKPSKKVPQLGSDFRSDGLCKGSYPASKFSPFNQVQGLFSHHGSLSNRPNGRTWGGNDRYNVGEKSNRSCHFEPPRESTRGPRPDRVHTLLNSSPNEQLGPNGRTWGGYDRCNVGEQFNRSCNFEAPTESTCGHRADRVHTSLNSSAEKEQLGPNGRTWGGYDRYNVGEQFNRSCNFEARRESTRGPRADRVHTPLKSSAEKEQLGPRVWRGRYNLPDFQIVYDNAKFFVIKSFSEDDIHKSIKYDVWSSTPYGNKKLNAAFHDANTRRSEMGTRCPLFLFFSVNVSGQFVGLAEMIGQVDFNMDMDFWQQDKWIGFFPVTWHIIKDIPNHSLKHIILENNDNRSVTFTRDTQEIGLKQGLEMLSIFKNYPARTSILDDFNFYEDKEKSLHARSSHKAEPPNYDTYSTELPQRYEAGLRKAEHASMRARKASDLSSSLATLTRNLSLSSQLQKHMAGKNLRADKKPICG